MDKFEEKLNELMRTMGDLKMMANDYRFSLVDILKAVELNERKADNAQKQYEKVLKDTGEYTAEFEKKKKAEHLELDKQKKETQTALDASLMKLKEAQATVEQVSVKEKILESKLAEVALLKAALEEQKERVRALAQSV